MRDVVFLTSHALICYWDTCSKGNPWIAVVGGILCDHQGDVLASFRSFLSCEPILYVELMAICEGLDLATQLGYFALEVESDSTTVVYWIHSQGPIRWDYVSLFVECVFWYLPLTFWLDMCFGRLHLLLIFWPIGLALTSLVSISCVLKIHL